MDTYYIIIDGLNIIVHVMLFALVYRSVLFNTMNKRSWLFAYAYTIIVLISEIGSIICGPDWGNNRIWNIVFNSMGFACSPLISVLLTQAISNVTILKRPVLYTPACINAVLCILSPWYGFIFQIDYTNNYVRGPLFGVYIFTCLFSIVILMGTTIKIMRDYTKQRDYFLLILEVFVIVGASIQIIWPEMQMAWLTICLANCLYYIYFCEKLQYYDAVTRLLNRQAYERKKLELSTKEGACINMLDIDDFKIVNDSYGHLQGDAILEETSKLIGNTFRTFGECFRIGGDEFCVLSTVTDENLIRSKIREFQDNIAAARNENRNFPGISLDYYIYNKSKESFCQAISEADARLYKSKQNNKAEYLN